MGNSLMSYRAVIGLFYNRCQKYSRPCKVSIFILFPIFSILFALRRLIMKALIFCNANFHFLLIAQMLVSALLLMCGDVESNPCPEHCISVIHSNIRSIHNKLEFIKNNFLDYNILCFTETHLDANIDSNSLLLSNDFDLPYR